MKKVFGNMIIIMLLLSLSGCTFGSDTLPGTAGKEEGVSKEAVLSENTDISGKEIKESEMKPETSAEETKESAEKTETSAKETKESAEKQETSAEETKESAGKPETSAAETQEAESTETMPQVIFEAADDFVYSMVSVHVRTGPGKSYPSAGCLEKGEKVCRTGIGNNGWYRIIYGNGIGYVSGNFMTSVYSDTEEENQETTEDTGVYTAVDETVYPTIILNVRTGPGTGYRKVGGFEKGEAVHRVAVGNNGWSKVEFRGAVYYASSEYLSGAKPETGEAVSSAESTAGETQPSDGIRRLSEEEFRVTGRWSGSNIRLDWTACDDVTQYIIYRKANWQKYELDRMASGSGQAFTDTTAVSDAEYFSEKGMLDLKTEYYEYYICTERENGEIEELGSCRISLNR